MVWYDPDPQIRRQVTFTVGAVVGALLLGVVWFASSWFDADNNNTDFGRPPTQTGAPPAASSSPSHAEHHARTDEDTGTKSDGGSETEAAAAPPVADGPTPCETVFSAQGEPLRAAAASLKEWEIHVDAMNQLVAGKITLAQATAFWERTRIGAARLLKQYDAAVQDYDQRQAHCPRPRHADTTTEDTSACIRAVAARADALREGRISLTRWRHHVHHMEMLRAGTLSPEKATRLWLRDWRAGVAEIKDYHTASGKARGLRC